MSRKGNPSSGTIRRAQLRPKIVHLTPLELAADLAIDKHDGIAVPDLGRAIGCSELVAYRVAEAMVAKGHAVTHERLLFASEAHYRAVLRSWS